MKTAPGEILALARIIEELDYYQLLDVRRDAGAGEVKRAYHARSRNFHPDANRLRFMAQFPSAGAYRLFLQFKTDGRVHTAAFTQEVSR